MHHRYQRQPEQKGVVFWWRVVGRDLRWPSFWPKVRCFLRQKPWHPDLTVGCVCRWALRHEVEWPSKGSGWSIDRGHGLFFWGGDGLGWVGKGRGNSEHHSKRQARRPSALLHLSCVHNATFLRCSVGERVRSSDREGDLGFVWWGFTRHLTRQRVELFFSDTWDIHRAEAVKNTTNALASGLCASHLPLNLGFAETNPTFSLFVPSFFLERGGVIFQAILWALLEGFAVAFTKPRSAALLQAMDHIKFAVHITRRTVINPTASRKPSMERVLACSQAIKRFLISCARFRCCSSSPSAFWAKAPNPQSPKKTTKIVPLRTAPCHERIPHPPLLMSELIFLSLPRSQSDSISARGWGKECRPVRKQRSIHRADRRRLHE